MDLLDRLLGHDAWTTRELLSRCRDLTDEQLDRDFDIALKSARATLDHIVRNVEVWTDLMVGEPVRAAGEKTVAALLERHDRAAGDVAKLARVVAARDGWDERWVDILDDPPHEKTFGGAIAHVITHSMHHRAQVIHILRRLGVEDLPEGDALSWENRVDRP